MKSQIVSLSVLLLLVSAFFSCKKDDADVKNPLPPSNESEIITTLRIVFVDSVDMSDIRIVEFRDPDGPGGVPYDRFDTIRLDSNRTYLATILLLNETVSPVDTISQEVANEADDHLFCFAPAGTSTMVWITDQDSQGLPVGLHSTWYSGQASTGSLQVSLHHQPGIKNGDCSLGETDVEVNFVLQVY